MVATSTILLLLIVPRQMLTIVGGIAAVMAITGMQAVEEEKEEVGRVQVVGCVVVADERVWPASWVRLTAVELPVALPSRLVGLEEKFHSRWVLNSMVMIVTSQCPS